MRSKVTHLAHPTSKRLIFGLRPRCGEKALILIPEHEAHRLAQIHRAISSAQTWGEFRERMPSADYQYVADFLAECGHGLSADSDDFCSSDLPGFEDGDWPCFVEQKMFGWLPREICCRFGRSAQTTLNGPMLVLDVLRVDQILTALACAGFECVRDDKLVQQACGDDPDNLFFARFKSTEGRTNA